MAREAFERFKQEIRSWLDSHPDEYDAFVEEMNDKSFTGIGTVTAVNTQCCRSMLPSNFAHVGEIGKTKIANNLRC